ncbi:MAG: hypothetical protein IKR25_13570 [Muribaculaceae bacterium]|nr:hypothetical protein [Muribaculaceae bacterium]
MFTTSVNQIAATDQIIATIEVGGTTLARIMSNGFSCTDDVVRTLKGLAGGFIGMAKLNIRNKTRGWNVLLALASHRTSGKAQVPAVPASVPCAQGRQYAIQWP